MCEQETAFRAQPVSNLKTRRGRHKVCLTALVELRETLDACLSEAKD
ncbi:MAG: hypothetical protein QOF02_988 [Blastocatellia bacterium]|jgi:hypothetical protein|nr:hypothetical protein [Blastocatellia bacterium]